LRAERFRQLAEHRDRAVERPGRAEIEAAREAQARISREQATEQAPIARAAEREAEAEAGA
jgi:hypothetical protein